MKKKNSKTDIFLKVIVFIGLLGLIVIFILLMTALLKDRFTSLDDYENSYTFQAGVYDVGADIPAGTYVIQMEGAKEAEINIYKDSYFQRKYYIYDNEKGGKAIIKRPYLGFGISGAGGSVQLKKRVYNITLEEGQHLRIDPPTSFTFYSN